jgi:hypothetical protein
MNKKNNSLLRKSWKKGVTLIDFLLYAGIIAVILGVLLMVIFPKANLIMQKDKYKSNFNVIVTGLKDYYGDNNYYPAGSGWSWNQDNAYVAQKIIDNGWQYKCSSNAITLTTPVINNKKVLVGIAANLKNIAQANDGDAALNGNQVEVTLKDKVCK